MAMQAWASKEKLDIQEKPESDKVGYGKSCVVGIVAVGTVLALMVAISALAFTVVLSQTEMNSLKQEVDNLRQILNQTGMNQAIKSDRLQQMLDVNIEQISTLQKNTNGMIP